MSERGSIGEHVRALLTADAGIEIDRAFGFGCGEFQIIIGNYLLVVNVPRYGKRFLRTAQFLIADRTINDLIVRTLGLTGGVYTIFFHSGRGSVLCFDRNGLFRSAQFLVAGRAINDLIVRAFGLAGGVNLIFASGACGGARTDLGRRLGGGIFGLRGRGFRLEGGRGFCWIGDRVSHLRGYVSTRSIGLVLPITGNCQKTAQDQQNSEQ